MKSIKSFLTESHDNIEPTIENFKKAMKICADAHHSEYADWEEDMQVAIKSESVPVVADVRSICDAFFGNHNMIDVDWGYTNVYLDEGEFLPKVNTTVLMMALPHGTKF